MVVEWIVLGAGTILFVSGFRIVRPIERAIVERFGKFNRIKDSGLTWTIPFAERILRVNTTEVLVDIENLQNAITADNLNMEVGAQVYFKVKKTDEGVKAALYNVNDVQEQIVQIARTTLRNVIGTMTLKDANSKRSVINKDLRKTLIEETANWGIEIVRTEVKEITPPEDVQDTMNQIVIAENTKVAARDFALAKQTEADGAKMAAIKKAEGEAQAVKINADGKAYEIEKVNKTAQKYFRGNAQILKKLETAEKTFSNNTKLIMDRDSSLVTMIDNVSGVVPVKRRK